MLLEGSKVEHVLRGDHYEVTDVTRHGEARLEGIDTDDTRWEHVEADENGPFVVEDAPDEESDSKDPIDHDRELGVI